MCGIAGLFARDRGASVDPALLERMASVLSHRGPDGQGVHSGRGFGLAHRRLSIVDLAGGAQPMQDETGRYHVTYNGEIYNFRELRSELERCGYTFRTDCDTEVLLHGYREWHDALPTKLRGMYAFVVVDEVEHRLFAARDRVGKKPLYYAELPNGDVAFGSEIKALLECPTLPRVIDVAALRQFFCLRYVPDPRTIFEGVHKLPPGHSLVVEDGKPPRVTRYWKLSYASPRSVRRAEDLSEEILERLDEAVRIRLMGEVPLGAFLSGGVDSFAVVDSMSRVSSNQVVACSVGFDDRAVDERPYARLAAAHCGAQLHEEVVAPEAMLDQDWLADTFDEPFADASAVPTYHVSRLARKHVTVVLSGDGGDENFAGYRRYKYDVLENRVRGFAPSFLWSAFGSIYPKADFLPRWVRFKRTFQNLARGGGGSPAEAYARSVSCLLPEELDVLLRAPFRAGAGDDPLEPIRRAYDASDGEDSLSRASAADFETNLPGDILTKVDRASMAVSLEVRAPLLDHEFVEAAARIPSAIKLAGGTQKAVFKAALKQRLGEAALNRPKQGFIVPGRAWVAGPLAPAVEEALADERIAEIVDANHATVLLRQHRAGVANHLSSLWGILSLHRFLRRWMP